MKTIWKYLKNFNQFLKKDNWSSFIVTLLLAFILIKFIFFPGLSFITGSDLPLVIVESCSMYHHEEGFTKTFTSPIYKGKGIDIEDTANWDFQNGFTKGDVIFVVSVKNTEVGDVIIFEGGTKHPLIHRLIYKNEYYATKGDNYKTNSQQLSSEKKINEDQLVGKALFKVPFIGWAKLIFFEGARSPKNRGLCK